MKCSLVSIVHGLNQEFPLETLGELDIQITDIRELSSQQEQVRQDVLYITHQNQLLHYGGPPVAGPVLCISHTAWDLRHSQATFPTLIMVLCREPARVYAALGRCLYQEGSRCSEMPEISGTFLRCRSLEELVEKGYGFVENPFAIHDADGKLLAYTRQAETGDEDCQTPEFLQSLCDFHSVSHAQQMEQSRKDQTPVLYRPEEGLPQLRMALGSRGHMLGYLTVLAQFHPFRPTDIQVTELLGCFVSLDLLRQTSIARTNVSDAGRLKSFLESGETNLPEVPQWLEQQICDGKQRYYLLLVSANPQCRMPFLDVDELLAQMDRLFPEDISTRVESGVVLLLRTEQTLDKHPGIRALEKVLAPSLAIGVSAAFTVLGESGHGALRQARSALELGCVLDPGKRCYCYGDYALYASLRAASARMDLAELLPTGLRDLMETDPEGEALRTLAIYLDAGGKKARAAEELFIHLNTLKYRLGQLAQRLDADLDDPGTRFSLEYALRVIRYLRCFGEQR